MEQPTDKSFFYPPGGILIWIVIYLELLTFGLAMIGLAYYGSLERASYHADSLHLNKIIASVNTLLLLSGGYFAVRAVHAFKAKEFAKSASLLNWTILTGIGFILLKLVEYYQKLEAGLDMNYSPFFVNYWLLTAFHWLHVLVGIVILFFIRRTIVKKQSEASLEDIEAGIAFWHMCDLVWLVLFPLLYLLF
jgi:nitric oxide reductase NorE protein